MTVGLMNRMASLTILSGKTATTNTTTTTIAATTTRGKILSAVVSRGGTYNARPRQYSTSPACSSFWMSQLPPPLLGTNMNNNSSSSSSSIRNSFFLPHIISNSRCQSTKASTALTKDMEDPNASDGSSAVFDEQQPYNNEYDTSFNDTIIATGPDGTQYAIPPKPLGHYVQRRHAPKIPPHMVQSRISKLRSISGTSTNIRHSPWRLNLICQFAQGQTVEDALIQLKFVHKVKAPLIYNLIQGTANSAKTKYGLLPSQLEVVECFPTQGTHLKRIKIMGRGRAGKMHRRFSHARVVLREIDFPLKIMQCTSLNQRNKWKSRMEVALEEQAEYRKEKEELEALEREAEEVRKKKEGEEEK